MDNINSINLYEVSEDGETLQLSTAGHMLFEQIDVLIQERAEELCQAKIDQLSEDIDTWSETAVSEMEQLQEDAESMAKLIAVLSQELVDNAKNEQERRALVQRITDALKSSGHSAATDAYSAGSPDASGANRDSISGQAGTAKAATDLAQESTTIRELQNRLDRLNEMRGASKQMQLYEAHLSRTAVKV